MPLDPNIIMGVNTQFAPYDPGPAMANAARMQQFKQAQDAARSQNALREILSQPDAIDAKTGVPTVNALAKISRIDPQMAMQMHDQAAQAENRGLETEALKSEAFTRKADMQADVVTKALETYDMDIEAGVPKEVAAQKAQKLYTDGTGELSKSGLFSEQEMERAPKKFEPDSMRAASSKYLAWKEKREADKRADRKDDLAEKREAAGERRADAQLGIERSRLGIEQQRANIERDKAKAAQAGGLSDDAIEGLAEQVINGNRAAIQGIGRGTQGAADIRRIQNRVYSIAKERGLSGKNLADATAAFAGEVSAARSVATLTAKIDTYANEAANAATMWKQAMTDLDVKSNFKPLTQAIQSGQERFNDPKLAKAALAANALFKAYAKAMNPTGAPHVEDEKYARNLIGTASSPAEMAAKADQILAEINGAKRASRQTMDDTVSGGAPAAGAKRFRYDATGKLVQQ